MSNKVVFQTISTAMHALKQATSDSGPLSDLEEELLEVLPGFVGQINAIISWLQNRAIAHAKRVEDRLDERDTQPAPAVVVTDEVDLKAVRQEAVRKTFTKRSTGTTRLKNLLTQTMQAAQSK